MISGQKDSLIEEIVKELIGQRSEGLKPVVALLMNTAMKIEREHFLGATPPWRFLYRIVIYKKIIIFS